MKITEQHFNQLKTPDDVNKAFKAYKFNGIYQVATKNLTTFSAINYPTQPFLTNLTSIIDKSNKRYSIIFFGNLLKLISKTHNWVTIREFKSKLTLATQLKDHITKIDKPPQKNDEDSNPIDKESGLDKPQEVKDKDPGQSEDELFLQEVEKGDAEAIVHMFNSASFDSDTYNRLEKILVNYPNKKNSDLIYYKLAECFYSQAHSCSIDYDYTRGFGWFIKAAEAGNIESMKRLCYLYLNPYKWDRGTIHQGNITEPYAAFEWIKKAAEAGDPEAMEATGHYFLSGIYKNYYYDKKVVHQGKVLEPCAFGDLDTDPDFEILAPNPSEGLKWLEKASNSNHRIKASAMLKIGDYWSGRFRNQLGQVSPVNLEESYGWYLKAAQEGEQRAMSIVADCLEKGEGVAKNLAEAEEWREKLKQAKEQFSHHRIVQSKMYY